MRNLNVVPILDFNASMEARMETLLASTTTISDPNPQNEFFNLPLLAEKRPLSTFQKPHLGQSPRFQIPVDLSGNNGSILMQRCTMFNPLTSAKTERTGIALVFYFTIRMVLRKL